MIKKSEDSRPVGMTKATFELYKCMKDRNDNGLQFTKEDMLALYNKYVFPAKRENEYQKRIPDEQVYNNASRWLDRSICRLIRNGYIGLMFNRAVEYLDIPLHEQTRERDKSCLT